MVRGMFQVCSDGRMPKVLRLTTFLLLLAPTVREAKESEESICRSLLVEDLTSRTIEFRRCTYAPRPHEKVFRLPVSESR